MNTAQESYSSISAEGFLSFLNDEFSRRKRSNPNYSLCSFARGLHYDVSTLSKIMRGRRPAGPKTIKIISERLGTQPQKTYDLVYETRLASLQEEFVQSSPGQFTPLDADVFAVMADWYHFAILELMHLSFFRPSLPWIAKTLGIDTKEAGIAIQRLKRLGYLRVDEQGNWHEEKGPKLTNDLPGKTTPAKRWMQRQLLEKSIASLETVPVDLRDHSSMTMAIDTKKIIEAKKKIKRFRREMSAFLSRSDKNDSVYSLTISLFPLTKSQGKQK